MGHPCPAHRPGHTVELGIMWVGIFSPWNDQSHAGDRDEANTVSEKGSLYFAVGRDKAEAT